MIDVSPIDELREARSRLAQLANHDPRQYAALLRMSVTTLPGSYLAQPLLPETTPAHVPNQNFADSLPANGSERVAKAPALGLP